MTNNLNNYFRIKRSTALLLFLFIFQNGFAAIRLPNTISSNMVLQQNNHATLWGWASPAEKIFVTTSWNNKTDSVVADGNAHWKIKIPTSTAGGPYTITLKGQNTITLKNILLGEVWVCSGQSNMEWSSYQKLQQILDELPHSDNNNIRLFQVNKSTATFPQDNIEGQWQVCGPESLKGFSAVGYFFAKELQKKLNVPVGIINSSWGGTPAETWTPAEVVASNNELLKSAEEKKPTPWWPVLPGYAYNAMIYPLTNITIAGAIWYQGESNTATYSSYQTLFSSMINSWRTAWKIDFPFYFVQIAPYTYGSNNEGNLLREQQTKTLSTPKTGMVVITDLVDNVKDIHPTNKIDVAKRLASYALAETYHLNMGNYKSPMFRNMEIKKGKAYLYFDNAPNGFMLNSGKTANEFLIAGADKEFLPATVKIEKDRLVVFNPKIKEPVAIRFSFSNTAVSNIFSKEGLPIAPFRTDDWPVNTDKVNP